MTHKVSRGGEHQQQRFGRACREASLEGVTFCTLRHTAATKLVGAHMPIPEIGRVLGHTQANTTYRYVNANLETARRAAAMDAYNAEAGGPSQPWELTGEVDSGAMYRACRASCCSVSPSRSSGCRLIRAIKPLRSTPCRATTSVIITLPNV